MTTNYNAPPFILAAIQRMYPDLPDLVGADWPTIKPQIDAQIAKLEATADDSITSMRLVSLLAEYEAANQRFTAEIKILLSSISPDDKGRGIGQVIHDVAPGASLAFYTGNLGQANFAQGILDLAAVGDDVIVDDVLYLDEPMYQDGSIAQAVNQVVAMGIPYFSSAGNDAQQSYESLYRPSETIEGSDDKDRQSYEELSEQEASVFRGMIQAGKINLTEADILLATNKEREQHGLAALSMTQVQHSLSELEKVNRIEKSGDKYRIIERYDSDYQASGLSGE